MPHGPRSRIQASSDSIQPLIGRTNQPTTTAINRIARASQTIARRSTPAVLDMPALRSRLSRAAPGARPVRVLSARGVLVTKLAANSVHPQARLSEWLKVVVMDRGKFTRKGRPCFRRAALSIRRLAILRGVRRVGAGGRSHQSYCGNQAAEGSFSVYKSRFSPDVAFAQQR